MHPSWRIPEETEKPFRKALDHASTRSVSELYDMLERLPEDKLAGAVGLCGLMTAYTAIDVAERKWPTDAQLRQMAQGITSGQNTDAQFGVTEQNLYLWLSQCALGFRAYAEVFGDLFDDPKEFMAAPFFFTINLISRFCPKNVSVVNFLEMMEDAYEKAFLLDLNLLPALMVRARAPQPEQAAGTNSANRLSTLMPRGYWSANFGDLQSAARRLALIFDPSTRYRPTRVACPAPSVGNASLTVTYRLPVCEGS